MTEETIAMDLTWGAQNFDRSSDTITIYRVSSDTKKKTASNYFKQVMKPMNYPACSRGSTLNGQFKHGKFAPEEGEYIAALNRGTFMGKPSKSGGVIVRVRAKGSLLQVDAKVHHNERSVHPDTIATISVRGDILSMDEAAELGLLEKITKEQRWSMFMEENVEKCFSIKTTRMSDQTGTPTMQKVKTKTGVKTIAMSPKAQRSVRVRRKK